MKTVTIKVENYLYEFFRKIGQQAGGLSAEQVSVQMMKQKGKM